jgi:hypothetical protein
MHGADNKLVSKSTDIFLNVITRPQCLAGEECAPASERKITRLPLRKSLAISPKNK